MPVAVTVIFASPGNAPAVALNVKMAVPELVTDAELNDAVTPAGTPDTDKAIDWAAPDVSAVETTAATVPPAETLPEVGDKPSAKSLPVDTAGFVTVSMKTVACVTDAAVPVTVSGYVPASVDAEAAIDNASVPDEDIDPAASEALTPTGAPLTDNVTVCAEPCVVEDSNVDVTLPPGMTDPEPGARLSAKSSPDFHNQAPGFASAGLPNEV